jgi:calcium-dependent protein kinase
MGGGASKAGGASGDTPASSSNSSSSKPQHQSSRQPSVDMTKESQALDSSLKSKVSGHVKHGDWESFYERKQDLGSGMSGVVFLVSLKADPAQTFACKSIHKQRMGADEVQALRDEIALCASLDHPNIVKIIECFESDKAITMIMECCRGGELYDSLIEEGEYTQQRAAELFRMMVHSVNYCHQVGVVHRDLKLENFVFEEKPTQTSELKLIDFGLSMKHRGANGIQKMKSVVGTAYYMAPEVIDRNVEYDSKCDVWALGVILFMMLTGSPPFNGSSERQIMASAAEGRVDWRCWRHDATFDTAKELIKHMLVPQAQRYDCKQVMAHKWLTTTGPNGGHGGKINKDVVGALSTFSKKGKLYRSSAQVIAVKLSPTELHELRKQFQLMDADASGTISLREFKGALVASAAGKVSDAEVAAMFDSIDLDGTGVISCVLQ